MECSASAVRLVPPAMASSRGAHRSSSHLMRRAASSQAMSAAVSNAKSVHSARSLAKAMSRTPGRTWKYRTMATFAMASHRIHSAAKRPTITQAAIKPAQLAKKLPGVGARLVGLAQEGEQGAKQDARDEQRRLAGGLFRS